MAATAFLQLALLLACAQTAQAQLCANSACVTAVACGVPDNYTAWTMSNQTVDGLVATNDLLQLLEDFGTVNSGPSDINGDGAVNVADILALLGSFGMVCG